MMPRIGIGRLALFWLLAEFVALAVMIAWLGLGLTLLLVFATSLAGFALLRRLGLGLVGAMQGAMAGGSPGAGAVAHGLTQAIAALLLILPGFISTLAGLALLTPGLRAAIIARFGIVGRAAEPGVIDLSAGDWTIVRDPPADITPPRLAGS